MTLGYDRVGEARHALGADGRLPEAGQGDREDVALALEQRAHRLPAPPVEADAVEQDQGRSGTAAAMGEHGD